jgi:creatinine amidohydrolase/Fe(II)-dependent formamide hydrolase-like protein
MSPANPENSSVSDESLENPEPESSRSESLSILKVIDRLEVGPTRLEKRRFIAPYKVVQDGKEDTFDLEYSFEDAVFDPQEPASQNLASMIACQVAINYGLFCEEIIFHGFYDQLDQQFIKEMAINTAREIYVKKFLEPNPFLIGDAATLPVVNKESYLQAQLIFPDEIKVIDSKKQNWAMDSNRHAILSSGGKDSLLSFGLIQEIGREVHPIFINESGRHWFTALNAHRYFKTNFPRTAKVWTNADRVYNWMLRHFPFIRQDYARIRSDEYPIRLWTVAVFLFGALPIMRKRGIERLIIGDEFDTSRRFSFKGITHYDGLYDQSRYFDNSLTRYFVRKGWGVKQFSIVRPLSELLIEKILVERYPELQQQQVSCHAAHVEGERVYPCGQCEKCRRIVGMLMALDADPRRCGYKSNQIDNCLKSLAEKGVHQEAAGSQQLLFLLMEKGLIAQEKTATLTKLKHSEIMKLRFDPERSPIEAIPRDIRPSLFKIYLEHADGAVERLGRVWTDFNPLSKANLSKPYPYESSSKRSPRNRLNEKPNLPIRSYKLGELTWQEAQVRFKEVDVALLPVGSIEQHGPHLPLDTDAFDAEYLALQVAEACSDPKPLVLPLIPYGVSYHHEDFSGTISITNETLARIVYEVGMSAARHGISKLVVVNGHGGNTPALQFAAQMINRDSHIFTCVDSGETSDSDIANFSETPNDVHAGEIETSTTFAIRPELVRLDKAKKFVPHFSSHYLNFSSKKSVEWYARTAKISSLGVLGDPTKASKEKGEKIWEVMIKNLVEFVEDLKRLTLDEIYQRRY